MITKYHRPTTLDNATALAALPDTVIVGGGTTTTARVDPNAVVAVDLQALALEGIDGEGESVRIGAMARLADVAESDFVPRVLADLAKRDAPNTIRNAATIGGTIGTADPESQLLVGLVAFGATVTLARSGSTTEHALDELLDDPQLVSGAIIISVTVPSSGFAAADRAARTPMDQPIVTAVAHRANDGAIVVALSGVAPRPVTIDPDRIGDLDPPSDFRGSSEYRRHLGAVLAGRVLATVGEEE
jgi:CO/xanthine dehydrogenase FAD-binding subunit